MTGFQPIEIDLFEERQLANGRRPRQDDEDEDYAVYGMRAALPVEAGEPDFSIPEEEIDAQEYLKRVRQVKAVKKCRSWVLRCTAPSQLSIAQLDI